jgi:hypothetical protein
LSYSGHVTAAIPFTREKGTSLTEGPDAVNTTKALEAATSLHNDFSVSERENSNGEVTGLEVEFVGGLAERATSLLSCAGSGLMPEGTNCEVVLDREGSKFAGEVVSKFSEDGTLEGSWGSGGQLNGSAAPAGAFRGDLNGVTVDASGVLWVYDEAEMYGFAADGSFVRDCRVGFGSAAGLAPGGGGGEVYAASANDVRLHVHVCEGTESVQTVAEPRAMPTAIGAAGGGGGVLMDVGGSAAEVAPEVADPVSFGPIAGGVGLAGNHEGSVFVASATEDQLNVFVVSLEGRTLPASAVTASSATLNGDVDTKGTEVVSCVFDYGESASYGTRVPCEPTGPINGAGNVEVHAPVTGLVPGSVYHYRLRLVNKSGETLDTNDEQFSTVAAGVVEESASTDVEPASVRLTAKVNPRGVGGTKCRIEYGRSEMYGESAACEPGEDIATGVTGVEVGLRLEKLSAGTTYYWRVVLSDEHDMRITGPNNTFAYVSKEAPPEVQAGCPNERLRGESQIDPVTKHALSSELPDCRAYEIVTPVSKNGALFVPVLDGPPVQISGEGSRVIASSLQCLAQSQSCTAARAEFGVPFEFDRNAAGWATTALAPPASVHAEDGQWGASAQTGMALFSVSVAGQVSDTFYARRPGGTFEAIGPLSETFPYSSIHSTESVATADLSHVIFWGADKQGSWPTLIGKGEPLFEYAGTGNSSPFLVDVEGGEHSTKTIGDCSELAVPGVRSTGAFLYALSATGEIVYFEVCPGGEEDGAAGGGLYARIDGEGPAARTVAVSGHAPSGAGLDECSGACASSPESGAGLEGVSEDGSRVFFSSAQQLTNDASEDEGADAAQGCTNVRGSGGCNLYLYEDPQEDGRLVDVSAGDVSGLGPQVQGVMAVSADGSHVYFVAKGVLAGANTEGRQPMEGADNLYMYERDEAYPSGRTVFVATLPGDEAAGAGEFREVEQWKKHGKAANVTPDGEFLVFTSHGALTPDDSRGLGPEQVYRYDAVTGSLVRVSVGEHGFDDDGNAGVGGARVVPPNSKIGQPRRDPSMSDDGSVVFFQSPVALAARALNDVPLNGGGSGNDLAQNVYEWEAPGARGCGEAAGCIYLISDGQDASESGGSAGATDSSVELLGSDASGDDVFFTTADRLVPADTDSELDIYDARVDGGFPAPVETSGCEAQGCHGEGPAAGVFGVLPSETLTGVGNLPPGSSGKPGGGPPPVHLTRSQLLAKALVACRKDRAHRKRVSCEKQARKRYGPVVRSFGRKSGSSSRRGRHDRRVR